MEIIKASSSLLRRTYHINLVPFANRAIGECPLRAYVIEAARCGRFTNVVLALSGTSVGRSKVARNTGRQNQRDKGEGEGDHIGVL